MKKMMTGISLLLLLPSCSNSVEDATFNVYFTNPAGQEFFLGTSLGLSACRTAVQNKAIRTGVDKQKWDYRCCVRTDSSECAEQLR